MSARRPWMLPLVPLYWAGLRAKDAARAAGLLRARHLAWPVLSVGSLSAGGAGKTPVVLALLELLRSNGHVVDVLSRGYGREGRAVERVDLTAPDPARRFGDEPLLLARAGAPVWVAADRHAAGIAAEDASVLTSGVHLLDDGFQHRRLARTLDIVLLTAADLDDVLLPAGNRREPFRALARAGAIVLREEEADGIQPSLRRWVSPGTPVWRIRRTLELPQIAEASLLAFCGIARPSGFFEMLTSCGLRVIDSIAFPDHHRYTPGDVDRLRKRLRSTGAAAFITTEKDAVKITPELRATLEADAPMHVARLRVEFTDAASVLSYLEARCL